MCQWEMLSVLTICVEWEVNHKYVFIICEESDSKMKL